jgi:hypothetical protein
MGKTIRSVIMGVVVATSGGAFAQPIVVTSQRFTFRLPGQAEEVVQPVMPATIDRAGTLTQTLVGGFGGDGTVRSDGTARGSANWTSTTISWSAEATIANTIVEAFEVDDYAEYAARAQVISEVRFQVQQAIEVQLTRANASGTSSGFDFLSDFGLPYLYPLDAQGEPIVGEGVVIGFSDPSRVLQPGAYLALVRSAAITITAFGNAPTAGTATITDGATLVVVPAPAATSLGIVSVVLVARRRR